MKNKVIIITGGTSGIGKAIALAYARLGAAVVVSGRSAANLEATRQELLAVSGRVLAVQADVAKE